jgi:hypothetical protein
MQTRCADFGLLPLYLETVVTVLGSQHAAQAAQATAAADHLFSSCARHHPRAAIRRTGLEASTAHATLYGWESGWLAVLVVPFVIAIIRNVTRSCSW